MQSANLLDDFQKAEAFLEQGDLRSAADLCKHMLDVNPAFAHGYHLMSSLFRTTGNLEKALNFSQLAIRIDPAVAAFHLQQGQVFFALSDWEAARVSFEKASQLDALNPLPLILWGDALVGQKEYGQAQALFKRARILEDIPEIDEHEGLCLMARGDMRGAERLFDRLIARKADTYWGHIHKGRVLFEQMQDNEAQGCFARALNVNPQAYEALHYLAMLSDRSGDSVTAVNLVMQAVQVNPSLLPSLMLLGVLLKKKYDYVSAEHVFRQALTLQDDNAEVVQCLVDTLVGQSRPQEALCYIDAILATRPDHAVMQHFRAMLQGFAPDGPPADYIPALFNGHARRFDEYLQLALHNKIPALIASALATLPSLRARNELSLLDLGCGSGAMAAALKSVTRTRIGVDVAERMLDKARRRQLYDELYTLDMIDYMTGCDRTFDLVIAADVLAYAGNARAFMHAARSVVSVDGLLVFSVDREDSLANFRLNVTGRYSHCAEYIALLSREEGYRIVSEQEVVVRHERGQPVRGLIYIVQKLQLH